MADLRMPWRVFYSYSHHDAVLRSELSTYLAPLRWPRGEEKIVEWYDRKIDPGANWETEISDQLNLAHLILFLVTENFLASEYCFGVEVERAFARVKRREIKMVPILLKPCLWKESRFSELQIIPRDGRPIDSRPTAERANAFSEVAEEIAELVRAPPPPQVTQSEGESGPSSLDSVRGQIASCVRAYEKIRQRIKPSRFREVRMNEIFEHLRILATLSYPLFEELADSPSPGERLAAVAILHVFPREESFEFLVRLVSEKPFVSYQAIKALYFAVGALDPSVHQRLLEAIHQAQGRLASVGDGDIRDRETLLRTAAQELESLLSSAQYD